MRDSYDVVRLSAGTAALAASAAVARQEHLSPLEIDVFRRINALSGAMDVPLRTVMQAGTLAAVVVAAAVAFATRRWRLARDLAIAGGGAWILAKALKVLVGRGRPGAILNDVVFRGGLATGLGFPSGHAAVAAALAGGASPYVGRAGRRVAWGVVAVVGVARIYVGAHLPLDVVGGIAVGWSSAALVHLLFGTPDGCTDERPGRRPDTQHNDSFGWLARPICRSRPRRTARSDRGRPRRGRRPPG